MLNVLNTIPLSIPTKPLAYVGVVISDIHCGAVEPKRWYQELKERFLNYIEDLAILDFVVITGDFFDQKISMNSEYAKYGLKFLAKLLKICERKGAKLRIIKGTESHDNKQLEIFEFLTMNTVCDFKVISTVEDEWLFEDMRVLYLPEEYVPDMDEYYKDYMEQRYDMIFGHGLIDKTLAIASLQESEPTMPKAPVFKLEKLLEICRGFIFFGHIHSNMRFDRFYYVNSFHRWAFGEEGDKGFRLCFCVPEISYYATEYVVNTMAKRYDTVTITCDVNDKHSEGERVNYMLKLANSLIVDNLRLEIIIPEEYPNANLLIKLSMEVFSKHRNIKLKIINNSKIRQKKEVEKQVNTLMERYKAVFNKGLPPEEKISEFIKIKFGRNIPTERIRQYIYDDIVTKGEK